MYDQECFASNPFLYRRVLQVDWERDVADAVVGQCRSTGEVGDTLDVLGAHHPDVVLGDVGEDFVELDVLLRMGTDQIVIRKSREREHWLTIELGVVEPVEQMETTGT
jgi:hypothetical protein